MRLIRPLNTLYEFSVYFLHDVMPYYCSLLCNKQCVGLKWFEEMLFEMYTFIVYNTLMRSFTLVRYTSPLISWCTS